MNQLLGAVEAGGTKFRGAAVSSDMTVVESVRVPTTDPDATLAAVAAFFHYDHDTPPTAPGSSSTRPPPPRWPRA